MNARATLAHIFWLPFMYVFLVAAQATVEQAKVDEAEMTQAKVDEATGGVGRQGGGGGEGIDQAFSAWARCISLIGPNPRCIVVQFMHHGLCLTIV